MNKFIGTKILNAKPMTKLEYNIFRGWKQPSDEDPNEKGMLVEYINGGARNTEVYDGYVSWSPMDVFTESYREVNGLDFGDAIRALKLGKKIARKGWNGKGMHLYLEDIPGYDPYIIMYTAAKTLQRGWLSSQADTLAEDWEIID